MPNELHTDTFFKKSTDAFAEAIINKAIKDLESSKPDIIDNVVAEVFYAGMQKNIQTDTYHSTLDETAKKQFVQEAVEVMSMFTEVLLDTKEKQGNLRDTVNIIFEAGQSFVDKYKEQIQSQSPAAARM